MKLLQRDSWSHQTIVETKSGLKLSIIGGDYLYSTPRYFTDDGEYDAVEIGIFDSNTGDWATKTKLKDLGVFDILQTEGDYCYVEDDNKPIAAAFGYIPSQIAENLIESLNK